MAKEQQTEFTESHNRKDFKSEKDYQKFIVDNIELFCKETLRLGKLISFAENKAIEKHKFGKQKQRVDLYIVAEKGTALVELKNPVNYFCEMRNAISQLLYYGSVANRNDLKYDKLCLVSPIYDKRIFQVILDYNLPIELYILTKEYNSKLNIR